ncbi:MAG: SDR family NAD(P)-dependent oxidoreductase [Myxococcales bacterium]|nr:SDR family NAD(P)-dependent oxidoreductase [Myxococcales bacterium]
MSKSVLITGATRGLGAALSQQLTERGWSVTSTSRRIRESSDAWVPLDLADLDQVRALADRWQREERGPIDVLICNAGVQHGTLAERSAQGFEQTFAVNHLAHFLLVQVMRPFLAEDATVVFVASGTHDPAERTGMPHPRIEPLEQLATPAPTPSQSDRTAGLRAYTTSKLCNVLCGYELERRLRAEGASVSVQLYDPGLMPGSGLVRHHPGWFQWLWRVLIPVARHFARRIVLPEQSAAILSNLLDDPAFRHGPTRYWSVGEVVESSETSRDPALAARLWTLSAALTALH